MAHDFLKFKRIRLNIGSWYSTMLIKKLIKKSIRYPNLTQIFLGHSAAQFFNTVSQSAPRGGDLSYTPFLKYLFDFYTLF